MHDWPSTLHASGIADALMATAITTATMDVVNFIVKRICMK
jgi:hypothetical protein